ncbi:MAG: hypothetical protein K0R57_3350 [Paenibacillaceae bacterium]|nr:hypothetical protein [Paenibacillaceae bacterium]
MIIIGAIVFMIGTLILLVLLGPVGLIIVSGCWIGLLLKLYAQNKRIHEDLQKIKAQLGIEDPDDAANFNMSDEAIEEVLLTEMDDAEEEQPRERTEADKEIEKELLVFLEQNEKEGQNPGKA